MAVAEDLSFSAAAKRLFVSQPPLSVQIKALEDELGVLLLHRNRREVALTPAGDIFARQIKQALGLIDQAQVMAKHAEQGYMGTLTLGFTASVPMFDEFPKLLQTFRFLCPLATLNLVHLSTEQQMRALQSGDIDIGFLRPSRLFVPPKDLVVRVVWQDQLKVVLPIDHELAKQSTAIRLEQLNQSSFILFPHAVGCGLFEHINNLCAQSGFVPHVIQEAREPGTIVSLVAAGMGISILPETYQKMMIPGVVYRELISVETQSRIVLATSSKHPASLVERFLGMMNDTNFLLP